MIRGTTKSGFAFELDDKIFDDFDLIELYAAVNENPIYMGKLAEKLLGKPQKEALLKHLRRADGIVHTTDVMNALMEIEEAIPSLKN